MALEDMKSSLYKDPLPRKKPLGRPTVTGAPSSGYRVSGLFTDVLPNRTSFYRPNFSTTSGISGDIRYSTIAEGNQSSPSQTIPLQLIKTGYFDGDYFLSGYYEQ